MSQIHYLELTRDALPTATLGRVARDVVERAGLLAEVGDAPDPAEATLRLTDGMWVWVEVPVITGPDSFVADFGIARAATVNFDVGGTDDPARTIDDMLRLALDLLARAPGDAVLHYEYTDVWLVRRGGQLLLNDVPGLWSPERLAWIPVPYQLAPLAFVET
jgi:hypothetical protein